MLTLIENKWDINYIQTSPAQVQQTSAMKKYWRRSSFTKKCTQYKTWHILKTDKFRLPDNRNIGKLFLFSWIKLISVLIHFKYCYYNIPLLRIPCLPCHPYQISPWLSETPLQCNPHRVLLSILSYPVKA